MTSSKNFTEIYKQIGGRIRELRLAHQMTQAQLAARLGNHTNTISRWETGDYKIDIHDLVLIAAVFQAPISRFFDTNEDGRTAVISVLEGGIVRRYYAYDMTVQDDKERA